MKNKKMLKRLIGNIEYHRVRPSDSYMNGYNNGLETVINIIKEKIRKIEDAEY